MIKLYSNLKNIWTKWELSLLKGLKDNPIGIRCPRYDISNLKKIKLELYIKNKLISKILSIQSHKVRASLASIKGLVELILPDKWKDKDLKHLVGRADIALKK